MSDPVIPAATAKERTQNWLKDVYRAELGREADAEGLEYWANDIAKGATRNEVLSNIRRSDEKWLGDTYKTELGRDLGDEGRNWWMGDLRGKGSGKEDLTYGSDRPVQTRDQVLENIRRSDEYKKYQAGDGGFIDDDIDDDDDDDDIIDDTPKKKDPNEDWRNIDWGKFNPNTAPEYKIDPKSPGISAAVSAGNRMTDDFYGRFLPNWKRTTDLGTAEIGYSNNVAMNRLFNRDAAGNVTGINISLPDYQDPKEQFDYYWEKMYGDKDD